MKTLLCLIALVAAVYFCCRLAKLTYKSYKVINRNSKNGTKYVKAHWKSEFFFNLTRLLSFLTISICLILKLLDSLIHFIEINTYVYNLFFGILFLVMSVLAFLAFKYHFKEMIKRKNILLIFLIILG